jgi:hypothetical protein
MFISVIIYHIKYIYIPICFILFRFHQRFCYHHPPAAFYRASFSRLLLLLYIIPPSLSSSSRTSTTTTSTTTQKWQHGRATLQRQWGVASPHRAWSSHEDEFHSRRCGFHPWIHLEHQVWDHLLTLQIPSSVPLTVPVLGKSFCFLLWNQTSLYFI